MAEIRAATPVVADTHLQTPSPAATSTSAAEACACLAALVSASETT